MPKRSKDKKPRKSRKRKRSSKADKENGISWETYFVGGKQKRRKVCLFDTDEWLLANADDIYLHQEGRHDLIHQRQQADSEIACVAQPVALIPMRHLPIVFADIQRAFEAAPDDDEFYLDPEVEESTRRAYIDISSGDIVWSDDWYDDRFAGPKFLCIDEAITYFPIYGELNDFISRLEDKRWSKLLRSAVGRRRKGTYRRFKTIVFGRKNKGLERAWKSHSERCLREEITEWLNAHRIEPEWVCEAPEPSGDM